MDEVQGWLDAYYAEFPDRKAEDKERVMRATTPPDENGCFTSSVDYGGNTRCRRLIVRRNTDDWRKVSARTLLRYFETGDAGTSMPLLSCALGCINPAHSISTRKGDSTLPILKDREEMKRKRRLHNQAKKGAAYRLVRELRNQLKELGETDKADALDLLVLRNAPAHAFEVPAELEAQAHG